MAIQVSAARTNLMGALSKLKIRPGGNLKLYFDMGIGPASLAVLKRAAARFGNGNLALRIDPNLTPAQLNEVFSNPSALRKSLRIENNVLLVGPERTSAEILAEINQAFTRSADEGINEFKQQSDLLDPADFEACLKNNIIALLSVFKGATAKTLSEFASLLNQVCNLQDHELNNQVIDELLKLDQYDMRWVADAFSVFQKKFPKEPQYFRQTADFYYNFSTSKTKLTLPAETTPEQYKVHDDAQRLPSAKAALTAYERLRVLVPGEFEAKKAEPAKAQPKKAAKGAKKKVKKGKKKAKSKRTRSVFAVCQGQMEKLAVREQRKFDTGVTGKIKGLWDKWDKAEGNDQEKALALMLALRTADSKYFSAVFERVVSDKVARTANFKKLNYLRDLAEENGFTALAGYFHGLGSELVAGIIEDIIHGRTFKDNAPNFTQNEARKLVVESHRVKSLTLLDRLLRDEEIEELDVSLLKGLIRASEDRKNPHQVEAGQTLALMYELKFDHLFLEVYMQQIAEKKPETYEALGKVLAEAVDAAKQTLEVFDHPDLRNTSWRDRLARKSAFPVAMQGSNMMLADKTAEEAAADKFKEALSLDPECTIALENLCIYSFNKGDFAAAIDYGGVLLARYYKTGKIHKIKAGSAPEVQAKFDRESLKKVCTSVGLAALRLFEKTHAIEYLNMARANIEKTFAIEPTERGKHSLLGVYLYTKDYDKVIKLIKEIIVGKPEHLSVFMMLTKALWLNVVPEKFSEIPLELIKGINDYCLDCESSYGEAYVDEMINAGVINPNERQAAIDQREKARSLVIDYVISLADYAIYFERPELAAEVDRMLSHYASKANSGKGSYYYAKYALALKAYGQKTKEGNQVARAHLLEIVAVPGIDISMYSEDLMAFSSLKANAFNLLVELFHSSASKTSKSKRRRRLNFALAELTKALNEFPDDPILLNTAGVLHDELGHKATAETYFAKALDVVNERAKAEGKIGFFSYAYINYIDLLLRRSNHSNESLAAEKKAKAIKLVEELKGKIRLILEAARRDISESDRFSNPNFFANLIELYCKYKFQPAFEVLELIMEQNDFGFQQTYLVGLLRYQMDNELKPEQIPQEVKDLAVKKKSTDGVDAPSK